ncbi:carbohydrate ABC transporter substrate-binding protein [Planosporangium flavigriseum]|uniref:Alpha-glucoside ABC transporter substrate-binding protein n=1 Tax=Planosporangium flavigriseum TaxID=373681 RepID=A0A8J3LSV8_9ACTN|nr:ABC transporter substrate-binding protein [Planosporangium flavigriseum]NJC64114.1 carbohydrate ABC transporter substrate-binding protein [Planosporangium flavigriseum]GIG72996.1 alpha-glucoside ABC transporter substrate-binding protein [Planosporangium flavigriseum]
MAVLLRGRRALVLVSAVGLALVGAAGCSSGTSSNANKDSAECAAFKQYQGHDGTTVSIYATIRDTEADLLEQAWKKFSDCTGIKIAYEGSGEMEAQIQVRVDGGNAPDLAFFPQPGLMNRFVKSGKLKPAPEKVKAEAAKNWSKDWIGYGSSGGKFYGAPLGSNVKSFVWYSPKTFKEKGYKIPTTWDELIGLSNQIAASGTKPWCAGIESGEATGWPATDWIEDIMLRDQGPDVYDQWVNHQIPFNDPKVASAVDRAGSILKNEKFVNASFGGVKSIATTSFQEGGLPILQGKCTLHRQASFYAAQWPKGTKVAEDGDVYAFYFPAVDASKGKPVLVAGEFVGAFADRPEVQAVQEYLASADFANSRAKLGSWVSANKGLDVNNVQNPIDKLSVQILNDPSTVARFDGSDQMPAAVGAGSFWKGMTDWINGTDTKTALDKIEASWPK